MICCENASSESLENAIFYVRSIRNILNKTSYMLIKNISYIYIYSAASCSKQLQNV